MAGVNALLAATGFVVFLALASQASAMRQQQEQGTSEVMHHLAEADLDAEAAMVMEAQSSEKTHARFASAFPELHAAAASTCPYGDVEASKLGGATSFDCNWKSKGRGNTCPDLQLQRLRSAHAFTASHHSQYVEQARSLPLKPLFDKSAKVIGDETYEDLVKMHIQGLERKEVVEVEDKIKLKSLAEKLGVPTTHMYYGAHKDDWERSVFAERVKALCGEGVDGFMVKATHLAWSAGQRIVRGWQEVCKSQGRLWEETQELADFIEKEVLGQVSRGADAHLRFLTAGVTVEELFRTGGHSLQPLEAKVTVLWGKVYSIVFVGSDHRGCQSQAGSWMVFEDETGWDLKGMRDADGFKDPVCDFVVRNAFEDMKRYAESFSKGVGADYMRVDFFLGMPDQEAGPMKIMMNECESVSGWPFYYLREGVGGAWRDGYLARDDFSLTPEKWDKLMGKVQGDRDALKLD